MKTSHCILVVLLALLGLSVYSGAAEKEKLEEGRYAIMKDGSRMEGSEHSWILWRLPNGQLELEAHFPTDKSNLADLVGTLSRPEIQAATIFENRSRKLWGFTKSIRELILPSDLSAIFDPDRQLRSLTVSGEKFNGSQGVGLRCKSSSEDIECTGTSGKTKVHIAETHSFFWWYGIPTLLHLGAVAGQGDASAGEVRKVTLLSFGIAPKAHDKMQIGAKAEPGARIAWGDEPKLELAELIISNLGVDTLVLGNKNLRGQKCKMEIRFEIGDPISLTVWTDAKGLVLAVEDAADPGYLIALTQYKNYAR